MNYPLISEYVEAIRFAEDNFEQLKHLRPVLDEEGNPVMTGGNFAEVFKMKDEQTGKTYAVKCFLKEQEGRAEAYRLIAEELEYVSSTFLTPIKYLDKELFVDTNASDETEFPVLLMDWVDGVTLDKYIRENILDEYSLSMLAYQFSRLAMWLIPQPFAHGDLKLDNILVRDDGTLVLVDYDGMYVPAMKGQKARELGSPDFRHPNRNETDFDEHIDDFSLISILLSLKAISLNPELLGQYGASDRLLFSEKDYREVSQCELLKVLYPSKDSELNILVSLYTLAIEKQNLSNISFRLLFINRPKEPEYENLSSEITEEDWDNSWTEEYDGYIVIYSKDRSRLLRMYSNNDPNSFSIKKGTRIICDNAFSSFWGASEGVYYTIGKFVIPKSVIKIGVNPFQGDSVNSIKCNSPCFEIIDDILYDKNKAKKLIQCYNRSPKSSKEKKNIVIPQGVTIIGERSFYSCYVERITIPQSVNIIEANPFILINGRSKKQLEIICESNYFKVEDYAIYDVRRKILISYYGKGNHFTIPYGTKIIGDYAFWGTSLESITIPETVVEFGKKTIDLSWEDLKALYIPKGSKKKFELLLHNYEDYYKELLFEQYI